MTVVAAAENRASELAEHNLKCEYPNSFNAFQFGEWLLRLSERKAWQLQLGIQNFDNQTANEASIPPKVISLSESVRNPENRSLESSDFPETPLLAIALSHLLWGRSVLYGCILEEIKKNSPVSRQQELFTEPPAPTYVLAAAAEQLSVSVSAFRKAADLTYLPRGLISRAWASFRIGDLKNSEFDLDEAWHIAQRGPMPLHMADIHLCRARLFFRQKNYPWKSPATDLSAAEKIIKRCGYGRRADELMDAKKVVFKD